jgi:hypothetical protein
MAERRLYDLAARALDVTGPVEWLYAEDGGDSDRLVWLDEDGEAPGVWMLVCPESDGDEDEVDDVVLEEAVARDLLVTHFQHWLAARGWQVQMGYRRGERFWRLADCLALRDGGGDRLDADYPEGVDELAVLVESVVAVHTLARPRLPTL